MEDALLLGLPVACDNPKEECYLHGFFDISRDPLPPPLLQGRSNPYLLGQLLLSYAEGLKLNGDKIG